MRLFWLVLVLPIIEIALFIQVGGLIGLWPTLALVLLGGVAGTALLRSQGAQAMAELQRGLGVIGDPMRPLAHRALILLAGMLLVVPGFFTDLLGLLLLVPGVRRALMHRLGRGVTVSSFAAAGMRRDAHRAPFGDGVIDGDYVVDDPRPARPPVDLPPELDDATPPRPPRGSGWTRH